MGQSCEKYPLEACFPFTADQVLSVCEGVGCVKTSMLRGLSLPLILYKLSICSPVLTLPTVVLDGCEFQVLKYYSYLLQVSVKHVLQTLYINSTAGSHKSSL